MHYVRCNRSEQRVALSPCQPHDFQLVYLQMRCPASHFSGLYNSLPEALGHRTYEASAREEDSLIATLELTVFTGFEKGGISKSLSDAIGGIQVVRGIEKPMLLAF